MSLSPIPVRNARPTTSSSPSPRTRRATPLASRPPATRAHSKPAHGRVSLGGGNPSGVTGFYFDWNTTELSTLGLVARSASITRASELHLWHIVGVDGDLDLLNR